MTIISRIWSTISVELWIFTIILFTSISVAHFVNKILKFLGAEAMLKMKEVVRWTIAICLFLALAISVHLSALQVEEGKTLYDRHRVYIENVTLPSLTLCPTFNGPGFHYNVRHAFNKIIQYTGL